VEGDGREAIDPLFHAAGEVLAVEERRVGEPCANHALVTCDDLVPALGIAVVHDDELVCESTIGAFDREVALVLGHGCLDDLARDFEELEVEMSHGHGGPLDQVDYLGKSLFRHDCVDFVLAFERGDSFADEQGAGGLVVLEQAAACGGVVIDGRGYRNGAILRQETVALRVAIRRQSGELHRHDVCAEQRDEPAHGADEARGATPPALGLGPVQALSQAGEHLGQHVRGIATGLVHDRVHVLAAIRLGVARELGGRDALAAREALGSLGGVALGVERGLDGGTLRPDGPVLLALLEARDSQYDPPRSPESLERLIAKARFGERLLGVGLELGNGVVEWSGGDLLGTDFEQQVAAHRTSPPCDGAGCGATSAAEGVLSEAEGVASRSRSPATYASQQLLASVRTRPMKLTRSVTAIAPRASSRLNACEHLST
jgi:hypothetical protein